MTTTNTNTNAAGSATFTVNRRQFAATLARINSATFRRHKTLAGCRVSVNGKVRIAATDTEQQTTETVNASDSGGNASVIVDAAAFRKAVNAAAGSAVSVELESGGGGYVKINGGVSLPALCADSDFPDIDHQHADTTLATYNGAPAVLAELLTATVYAVDNESSRFALGGVCVELEAINQEQQPAEPAAGTYPPGIRLIATDGRRLVAASAGRDPVDALTFIWHGNFCKLALKALKNKLATAAALRIIERGGVQFLQLFVADSGGRVLTALTCRAIDGRFPRWRDVMPKDTEAVAEINAAELAELAKTAQAVTVAEQRGVKFLYRKNGGRVYALARVLESGTLKAETTAAGGVFRNFKTTIDARYIGELAKAAAAGSAVVPVTVSGTDPDSASLFEYQKTAEAERVAVQSVIMPLSNKQTATPKPEKQNAEPSAEAEAAAEPDPGAADTDNNV